MTVTSPGILIPTPVRAPRFNLRREQIAAQINANRQIADVSSLREALITSLSREAAPSPVFLQAQNRAAHLHPFLPFFKRILDPQSPSARMRAFVRNLEIAAQFGWKSRDFLLTPSVFDRRFSEPDDLIEPLFACIFQDREAGLLRQWMRALDAHVLASSRSLLHAMDQAARARRVPVKKSVVLVGGGPLTSLAASVLGAFFHVTVVTEQSGLGKPWRNRPIYINSSSLINDFSGAPLPLLDGATTRVVGREQMGSLDVDLLLGNDTRSVRCDDGSIAQYISGPRLGDLVATNLVLHADEYLVHQRVEIPLMQRTADGGVRLTLTDVEDGTRRELDAEAVFLLMGPGKEQSRVPGVQQPYREAQLQLEADLARKRSSLAWHREAQRQLDALPSAPGVDVQRAWIRQCISQQRIDLPRVLTLTAIEKLYEVWEDFGADPEDFPLIDLVARPNAVAYIGSGDTMRTVKELVERRGPVSAYPDGLLSSHGARSTIYNEVATSAFEYDTSNRRRYGGTFTPATTALPFKASRYRMVSGNSRVEVTHRDDEGTRRRRRYGYAFDCTGLDRCPIEATLPPCLPSTDIRDLQGIVVARGNADTDLFIGGSATSWNVRDFPGAIGNIVEALGIPENTVALWANGPLVERLAYTYAATRRHTK